MYFSAEFRLNWILWCTRPSNICLYETVPMQCRVVLFLLWFHLLKRSQQSSLQPSQEPSTISPQLQKVIHVLLTAVLVCMNMLISFVFFFGWIESTILILKTINNLYIWSDMCIVHLNFRPYICGDTSNAFAHRAGEPQETICRFVWPREREREILLLQLQSVLMLKNS